MIPTAPARPAPTAPARPAPTQMLNRNAPPPARQPPQQAAVPFSMAGAKVKPQRAGKDTPKLPHGRHKVRLTGLEQRETRAGAGFFVNFSTVDGGLPADFCKFPFNNNASGGMTAEDKMNGDFGQMKQCIAAIAGYSTGKAQEVVTDEFYAAAIGINGNDSPLVGRIFYVESYPSTSKKTGVTYTNYAFAPAADSEQEKDWGATEVPAHAPAAEPASPPVSDLVRVRGVPGWELHPNSDEWMWNHITQEALPREQTDYDFRSARDHDDIPF